MSRPRNPNSSEALLEAARTEFSRRGVEGARVEDIARRAGVAKGSFYLHFGSKEDAFRVLLQRLLGALEEQTRRRNDDEDRAERELGRITAADVRAETPRFHAWLERESGWDADMLEVLWRNRSLMAAVDAAGAGPTARLYQDYRQRIAGLVDDNLRRRRAAGMLRRDLSPAAVADMILGSFEAFARRMPLLPARPDLAGWARSLLLIFYRGAATPPPGRRPSR